MTRTPARLLLSVVLVGLGATSAYAQPRTAKVAGAFYPADPKELRSLITTLLEKAPAPESTASKPRMLITPHAGYPYSGIVAAHGFGQVQGRAYDGVVVVGFTHRDQFEGSSVDDRDAYQTPLGLIPVDTEAVAFLKTQPRISHVERAHESNEHSLEVMLPFLQVALGEFRLVPILMGSVERQDAEALASALDALSKRGDYLFVFSTDLSHYHPYDQARQLDERTVNAILFETPQAVDRLFRAGYLEACGRGPILASLLLAVRHGYPERRLLRSANSGDTTGDTSRGVVGYASIGMYERATAPSAERISQEAGMVLVAAARQTLLTYFQIPVERVSLESFPELQQARGMFVTLRRKSAGELRGCIGRIETDVLLATLLPTVALDAALHDARFSPLTVDELDDVAIEVSILTSPKPIRNPQEVVAGRDGMVLQHDGRGGVFLPQVWHETGWTRVEFLRELAHQKAGLDPDAWQQAQLFTYQDQTFSEPDFPSVSPH